MTVDEEVTQSDRNRKIKRGEMIEKTKSDQKGRSDRQNTNKKGRKGAK